MSHDPTQGSLGFVPAGSQPVATSEDAGDALSDVELNRRRLLVLSYIAACGARGATADEVVAHFGDGKAGDHNAWAPRVTELHHLYRHLRRRDGKELSVRDRRPTRRGATAFVYELSDAGREHLARGRAHRDGA